jgi:protease IV
MRNFLKIAAASAVGTVVGLFTLLLLLGIGAFGLFNVLLSANSSEPELELEEKSVLVFDLSTEIVDAVPASSGVLFEEALSGVRPVSLYGALQAIAAAAQDENIAGIYLKGSPSEGQATLKELRQALTDFKSSGKPIWAYSTGFRESDYYMASVADNVVLAPVGSLEMNGFRAETQFLANALQKYGVGVQVLRVGRYKAAVEPFTRSTNSPEAAQQSEALISDLWQDFLQTVAESRSLTPASLQQLADAGGQLQADQALSAKLVDRLGFYNDVLVELQKLTGTVAEETDASEAAPDEEDDFPQVSLDEYAQIAANKGELDSPDDTVAVIYAEGNIIAGDEAVPGSITSEDIANTLRKTRRDPDVKAVVLRVNSPGGSAIASEIISNEVKLLADAKPLIVSMGDYAASGGYMIAAPGAKILASPTTITGSIGVYGLLLNFQEIANKNGITWDVVKTARFADMRTTARPQSEAELKIQQSSVDNLYDRFLTIVAEGRQVSKSRVSQVAQGRVWTGKDAIAANLVDQLGGLNDAIALAAKTAKIEDYQIDELPKPSSFEEQLIESLFGSGMTTSLPWSRLPWNRDVLTDEILKLREELTLLETLNDPNNLYMRLPFTTDIE